MNKSFLQSMPRLHPIPSHLELSTIPRAPLFSSFGRLYDCAYERALVYFAFLVRHITPCMIIDEGFPFDDWVALCTYVPPQDMDIHYGFTFHLDRIGLSHMNQASPISINNILLLKVKASKKDPKHVFSG